MKSYELRTSDGSKALLRGFAASVRLGIPGDKDTAVFSCRRMALSIVQRKVLSELWKVESRPAPTDDQELVAELARIAATGKDLAFLGADLSDKERQLAGLTE